MASPRQSDIDRFFSKLVPSGDCLLFQQNSDARYGQFGYTDTVTGFRIRISAHRFAYIQAFGPIPDGMFVMHQCDNPRCCNPTHLYLGTPQDNTNDMMEKGRHPVLISRALRKQRSKKLIDEWYKRRNKQ